MLNHTEYLLMCDVYTGEQMERISGLSKRTIKYWKIKGFPDSTIAYLKLNAKWQQLKEYVDPNGNLRNCEHIKSCKKDLELQAAIRKAESTDIIKRRRKLEERHMKARAKKLESRKVSLQTRASKRKNMKKWTGGS